MSFQPVQKLVTLNDLEWHNGPYCIISPNLVAFEAHFTKVVEVEIVENKHSFDIVFFRFSAVSERDLIQLSLMARICRNCKVSYNKALFQSILTGSSDSPSSQCITFGCLYKLLTWARYKHQLLVYLTQMSPKTVLTVRVCLDQ